MCAGTGTLTIANTMLLNTNNQQLIVTANDIDLVGTVSTGTAAMTIHCFEPGRTVGLGDGQGQMRIRGNELQLLNANGLTIGGANCGKQTSNNVAEADTQWIDGVLTLLASRPSTEVSVALGMLGEA